MFSSASKNDLMQSFLFQTFLTMVIYIRVFRVLSIISPSV